MDVLCHFSEDASIDRCAPHIPETNPARGPAVWAIDAEHAPLSWFPRDCPRVTVWPRIADDHGDFQSMFCTAAARVHAVELGWLDRTQTTRLFRCRFNPAPFRSWPDASGSWIGERPVEPIEVEPVGDLLATHVDAGIEFGMVPSLWPLHDAVQSPRWDLSIVRMRNAKARP